MKEIFNKKMILLGLLIGITIGFISVLVVGVLFIIDVGIGHINSEDVIFCIVAIFLCSPGGIILLFISRLFLNYRNKIPLEKIPNFKIWVKIIIFIFVVLHFFISVTNDRNVLGLVSLIQSLCYLMVGLIITFDRRSPKYITIPMIVLGASSFPLGLLVIMPAIKIRKLIKRMKEKQGPIMRQGKCHEGLE